MAKHGVGRRQSWAGAAVGAVALVLVLVLILFGRDPDGGQGQDCGRPLPLLVEVELDAAGFANAASSLARVVEAAEAGDLRAADEAFFGGGVHAFTHTVDATLRGEAPELARPLCEAVLDIEDAFIDEDADETARQARRIDAALRAAAPSFGVSVP